MSDLFCDSLLRFYDNPVLLTEHLKFDKIKNWLIRYKVYIQLKNNMAKIEHK